ncbi:MAG TPA: tetratricopeptide repeat protein [Ktedonobacteraceae bacterium]|nr:tetratricopeptide repeat protein [Ktedonobacteraceae bacterium]
MEIQQPHQPQSRKRFITITIIIAAVIVTIILILGYLTIIPPISATIISSLIGVVGVVLTIMPFVSPQRTAPDPLASPPPPMLPEGKSSVDTGVLPPPPAASGLVGREKDQEWLESCILAGKIVGVSGMPGIGKTTLVADTINKVEFQFHCVVVVDTNGLTNPMTILRTLIKKLVPNEQELLNRPNTEINTLYEALSNTLRMRHEKGKRVLIVIDDVEQSLVKHEGFVRLCHIFRSTQVSVVMTARQQLPAQLIQDSRELQVFTDEVAIKLFTRLLLSSGRRFEQDDVAEICKITGNHTLAIELIAHHFQEHPEESLTAYLRQLRENPEIILDLTYRLHLIEATNTNSQTLASQGIRFTFAHAYSQLDLSAQQLFVALGTLTGRGCTYQAVQALGAVINQSEKEALESLGSLIRSKLVSNFSADGFEPIQRIQFHPLLQAFARDLLRSQSSGSAISEDSLKEALATHYAEWVQKRSEDVLRDDHANLGAALKWAKDHLPQAQVTLAGLTCGLRWYWQIQFQYEEAFEWLQAGCDLMEHLGPEWYTRWGELVFAMGAHYQWIGNISEADLCYKRSFMIFRKVRSKEEARVGMGEARSGLAALAQQKGDTEKAQHFYQKSLNNFRQAEDLQGEADALYRLGFLALRIGDTKAAEDYYRESLNKRRSLGDDQWGEGVILYSLGNVFQQIGEIDEARKYYEDSLTVCRQIKNRRVEGIVLKALGDLALQTTGPTKAKEYLTESHDISREIFDPQSESIELYSMGFLLRQIGEPRDAWDYYSRSLEIRKKIQDERGRGFTLKGLGDLARRIGDMNNAKELLDESLDILKRIEDQRNKGVTLKALGDWAWQNGDLIAAKNHYEESLAVRESCHDLRGKAITLKALGDLALKEQDRNTAEDFLLESLKLFRKMNDQRGEGVTLHSLGMLALEQNNSFTAQNYFDQSLSLLHRVQDRQSRGIVLYTLALLAEMQENLDKAEESYRESLEIAIKVKAINSLRISQEAFRGFLLKRYGGTIFVEAARVYKELSGYDSAEHSEEQSIGKYYSPDRDKIVCALIYDLDEGPNGQSFVVPTERLVRRSL